MGKDTAASFSMAVDSGTRRFMKERKRDAGKMQPLGVFAAGDDMLSMRFLVTAPSPIEPNLQILDAGNKPMDVVTQVLSYAPIFEEKSADGGFTCVVAAQVPRESDPRFAVVEGAGFLRLTELGDLAFTRWRDSIMCNPGIDGRYDKWIEANEKHGTCTADLDDFELEPKMSVVTPIFNTPLRYFNDLIDSMKAQTYPNWEHVLVNASPDNAEVNAALAALDDERFVIVTLDENKGIPGNTLAGIEASSGDYISFVDHDDVLSTDALMAYVQAINEHPEADLLFCDEDTLSEDGKVRSTPIFKPDFQSDLFTSWNYLLHMLTVSRRAFDKIVPPGDDVNGAQDYDMGLKIWSAMDTAVRVPGIQYHWRQHDGSVNGGANRAKPYVVEASVKALNRRYEAEGIPASSTPHDILWLLKTNYEPVNESCVSIIINSRGEELTAALQESLKGQRQPIIKETIVVDDGAITNAIQSAQGEYIALVDDSVIFIDEHDAIGRMVDALAAREDLGIVSAKSQTPEGLNLHAGLCVKSDGTFGYLNQGFVQHMGGGYNGCAECQCDYSAVDLSCVAFRKADFDEVGGFADGYESDLAFDIDFSFRMRALGKCVMVDPDALVTELGTLEELVIGFSHLSNEPDDRELLWSRWDEEYRTDVLANPNYTLDSSYFNLKLEK